MLKSAAKALASVRLTVLLLALAMVLIFIGTLAQTRIGVWRAVDEYFRSPIAWVDTSIFRSPGAEEGLRVPMPGGLVIGILLLVNLLAAHAVSFRAGVKRAGVLVLHAGLIVLLAGEIVTGALSDEGLLSIDEGSRSSVIEDIRSAELALIDTSDPAHDRVVTIPGGMLASAAAGGGLIEDPRLGVAVRVDRWMTNAALFRSSEPSPANRGIGLGVVADERPEVAGVEASRTDMPAAYITLLRDGRELGTWLVSAGLPAAQPADDRGLALSLRYRRTYLPFSLHLDDFRHDVFTGTTIPRNFSSDVRVIGADGQELRAARIWMNNPLRYAGRTFYQASYKPDGTGTILQVVRNPGWLLPYAACILVGGGMLFHFIRGLVGFLHKRAKAAEIEPAAAAPPRSAAHVLRWAAFACGLLLAVSGVFKGAPRHDPDVQAFAHLPVSAGGRIKPIDTAARSLLMLAGGRQSVKTDDRRVSAPAYFLELVARPEKIADLPVVRIDHPEVLTILGKTTEDSGRHSLKEIEPKWEAITAQARRASEVPPAERDGFQRAILQVHSRVNTILSHAQLLEPYLIPPTEEGGEWQGFRDAFEERLGKGDPHPAVAAYGSILGSAHDGDAAGFEKAVTSYTALLERSMPDLMRKMRLEVLFNRAELFSGTAAVYLLAALVLCGSFVLRGLRGWEAGAERMRAAAAAMVAAAVLVHAVAIIWRVYLQGRPPVTNLYSSAVFVGWAAALAGVWMERYFPMGLGALCASIIGAGTLIVAHNLGNDGDTMQMMQAVLDSNFWLATHVVTITLGYSATFLAGTLGALYLLGRSATRWMTPEREQATSRMIYGMVCFALLLSFVGTVLGGIWADQSWGRFWGWDPKENGAALVVLINAIILHARWGGLVRARGIAALAVAGNIVTVWSWFGTNMLGVGLHAYGFMDSAARWIWIFVYAHLAVIALAALPGRQPRTHEEQA